MWLEEMIFFNSHKKMGDGCGVSTGGELWKRKEDRTLCEEMSRLPTAEFDAKADWRTWLQNRLN